MYSSSIGRKTFQFFNGIFILLVSAAIVVPLLMIIVTSLSPDEIIAGKGFVLIPRTVTFANYSAILNSGYMPSFYNSILVTVSATVFSMAMTLVMGYALAHKSLPGRTAVIRFVIATMMLDAGIIPFYMVVRYLGMIDSYASLIIPSAISTYNLILMKNYMGSIPDSLLESARIDGCTELGILW